MKTNEIKDYLLSLNKDTFTGPLHAALNVQTVFGISLEDAHKIVKEVLGDDFGYDATRAPVHGYWTH